MTLVRTEDAVGQVLCHDITQIIPNTYKGARFRKGHIITAEDIPALLSLGKEHLYIWEKKPGMFHEEEAAELLCGLSQGPYMVREPVREGKIVLSADCDGLFKVKTSLLYAVNSLEGIIVAARQGNRRVQKGDKLAAVKVVPLVIEAAPLKKAQELCQEAGGGTIFEVAPFTHKQVGLVVTGSEVYHHRIKDAFSPVIQRKLEAYNAEITHTAVVDDDPQKITEQCLAMIAAQCSLIICTGGMSVDPDDKTPLGIRNTGAELVSYGAPVIPGGMMMLSYYKKETQRIPILGLPACVMYAGYTAFDLLLPRIMADDEITRASLAALGEGGLL